MGPKKEPAQTRSRKEEPGAKIATIAIGAQDNPLQIKANLNCPLDMLLDYARIQFLKKLDSKLSKSSGQSAAEEAEETAEPQNMSKFWVQFHGDLSADEVALDLIDDSDTLVDCQQDVKRYANTDDILAPFTTYTLAVLRTDSTGQVTASPLAVRNGERVAAIVKGSVPGHNNSYITVRK